MQPQPVDELVAGDGARSKAEEQALLFADGRIDRMAVQVSNARLCR